MNTMISVRMSAEMLEQTERVAKVRGYLSTQEYVRETVRQDIERYNEIKAGLDAIVKSAQKVKPRTLTREERDALAMTSVHRRLTPTERALLKQSGK
jgi:Arc/MetJ-type ribon-helix-helix transcriptional regulator